jgi:ankyrin repeat protein
MLYSMKLAIKNGDKTLCKTLLDQGLNANEKLKGCATGCTPLLLALEQRKTNIADFLIDRGAEICGNSCAEFETEGYEPLHYAAAFGNCSLLRKMLDLVPDYISAQPVQPLHLAVASGCLDCIRTLLDHDGKRRRHLLAKDTKDYSSKPQNWPLTLMSEDGVCELVRGDRRTSIVDAGPTTMINIPINQANLNWEW